MAGPQLPPAAGSFLHKNGCCECSVTAALLPEQPIRCKLLPPLLLMLVLPVPTAVSRSLCIWPVLLLILLAAKPPGKPSVSVLMLLDCSPRPPTTRARPGTAEKLPLPASAVRAVALLLVMVLAVPLAVGVGPEDMPVILLLLPVLLLLS